MFEEIINAIEEAKTNVNHEYCYVLPVDELREMIKSELINGKDFAATLTELASKNNCTISIISECTMAPKLNIKYLG